MDSLVKTKSEAASVGLLEMAGVLLKVGSTGFGGAMPMLALLQTEYVQKRRWVSQEEFDEAVVVGQIMPGPIAVDAITHMGYRLRGWPGAIVSWVSFILPSFLLMLALTLLYVQYGGIPQVSGVLKGLGAAVVAVILSAAWRMGKPHLKDIRSAILMAAALLALLLLQVNVVLLVIMAGLAGLALFRKPSDFPMSKKKAGVRPMKGDAR
ncbi:MAG: chromate transporter [Chloroflexota bacterium]|jgi:chromate transporter